MQITLLPGTVYQVKVAPGELLDEDGRPAAGLCVWLDSTIWISPLVPVEKRREILVHEMAHAWRHHVGRPTDDEGAATNATAFDQVCRQIRTYELEHLTSEGIIDHGSTDAVPALPIGAECAGCGQRFSMQQIADEPPRSHPLSGRQVLERGVYCDFCSHVQTWMEAATDAGDPTGVVVAAPEFLTGARAMAWMERHPRQTAAAGVVAA